MLTDYLNNPPKNLFFTGKGGVGKTTTSAATAIVLADSGKRVLLVSTDPASNLDEVLGVSLSGEPIQVPAVPGLFALNVDPEQAAAAYREQLVGPYRGILPDLLELFLLELHRDPGMARLELLDRLGPRDTHGAVGVFVMPQGERLTLVRTPGLSAPAPAAGHGE